MANLLASGYPADKRVGELGFQTTMDTGLGDRVARNVKQLREARGLTQQQMAKLAGLPRATWTHLESGAANPTLGVLKLTIPKLEEAKPRRIEVKVG